MGCCDDPSDEYEETYPKGPTETCIMGILHIVRFSVTLIACFAGPALLYFSHKYQALQLDKIEKLRQEVNIRLEELDSVEKYFLHVDEFLNKEDAKHFSDTSKMQQEIKETLTNIENIYQYSLNYGRYLKQSYQKLREDLHDSQDKLVGKRWELENAMKQSSTRPVKSYFDSHTVKMGSLTTVANEMHDEYQFVYVRTCTQKKSVDTNIMYGYQMISVYGKKRKFLCKSKSRNLMRMDIERRSQSAVSNFSSFSYHDYLLGFGRHYYGTFFYGLDLLHLLTLHNDVGLSFRQECDTAYFAQYNMTFNSKKNYYHDYRGVKVGPAKSRYELSFAGPGTGVHNPTIVQYMADHPAKFIFPTDDVSRYSDRVKLCFTGQGQYQGFWMDYGCPVVRKDNITAFDFFAFPRVLNSPSLLNLCSAPGGVRLYSMFNIMLI